MRRRIPTLCCFLAIFTIPAARAQELSPLRTDGNGIAILQRPIGIAVHGLRLGDALRDVAQSAGISLVVGDGLAGVERTVTLEMADAPCPVG